MQNRLVGVVSSMEMRYLERKAVLELCGDFRSVSIKIIKVMKLAF